jgi:hypothetical protein
MARCELDLFGSRCSSGSASCERKASELQLHKRRWISWPAAWLSGYWERPVSCTLRVSSSIFLRYLLTYSMEQSPSWEANQWTLQLVKNFPAFMKLESPSPYPQSARHLSLSWANSIQSPRPPPTSLFRFRLRHTFSRNTPPWRSEWGSSLPPDCFVSRGSISNHG